MKMGKSAIQRKIKNMDYDNLVDFIKANKHNLSEEELKLFHLFMNFKTLLKKAGSQARKIEKNIYRGAVNGKS